METHATLNFNQIQELWMSYVASQNIPVADLHSPCKVRTRSRCSTTVHGFSASCHGSHVRRTYERDFSLHGGRNHDALWIQVPTWSVNRHDNHGPDLLVLGGPRPSWSGGAACTSKLWLSESEAQHLEPGPSKAPVSVEGSCMTLRAKPVGILVVHIASNRILTINRVA